MRDMQLFKATAGVALAAVLAVAVTAAARSRQAVEQGGVSSLGAVVYNEHCAHCHLRDSARWTTGPGLVGLFGRNSLPASHRPVTPASVLRQINDPYKDMPSFRHLSEEQKSAVVAYLKTF